MNVKTLLCTIFLFALPITVSSSEVRASLRIAPFSCDATPPLAVLRVLLLSAARRRGGA